MQFVSFLFSRVPSYLIKIGPFEPLELIPHNILRYPRLPVLRCSSTQQTEQLLTHFSSNGTVAHRAFGTISIGCLCHLQRCSSYVCLSILLCESFAKNKKTFQPKGSACKLESKYFPKIKFCSYGTRLWQKNGRTTPVPCPIYSTTSVMSILICTRCNGTNGQNCNWGPSKLPCFMSYLPIDGIDLEPSGSGCSCGQGSIIVFSC